MGVFLKWAYRFIQAVFIKRFVLPFYFSSKRRETEIQKILEIRAFQVALTSTSSSQRIWFHAASVGELECLWPLITSSAAKGSGLIVTLLSESAEPALRQLKTQILKKFHPPLLLSGYSPWEGEWSRAIKQIRPSIFVTAKYEAWPDLWMSLAEQKIPLAIVGARVRRSLKIAKSFCRLSSTGIPKLILLPALESESQGLQSLFPSATVQVGGEPRWDRVFSRLQQGHSRCSELIHTYEKMKRPWGVIGSAWMEDLHFLEPFLKTFSGTLWVVPHRIDERSIEGIEIFLSSFFKSLFKTSEAEFRLEIGSPLKGVDGRKGIDENRACILVNEVGFLSELYAKADWAFVGGGFGLGIHSTIEPAIHGIPIAVGPNGTDKFSEVKELSESGQLFILKNTNDLENWGRVLSRSSVATKKVWIRDAQARLGATQKIMQAIENFQ